MNKKKKYIIWGIVAFVVLVLVNLPIIPLKPSSEPIQIEPVQTKEEVDSEFNKANNDIKEDTNTGATSIDEKVEDDTEKRLETSSETKSEVISEPVANNERNNEIDKPSEDHKARLIAMTQLACKDNDIKLKYQGKDTWNVAVNRIDNKNRWIVTTNDSKYGRVKSIFEWTGEENDDGILLYLLVQGQELYNKL